MASSMVVARDEEHWVQYEFIGRTRPEDWSAAVPTLQARLDRGQPFVVLSDALRMQGSPDAAMRKEFSDMISRQRSKWKEHCVGWANVFANPVARGVMTAISWLSPIPFPSKAFATVEDAEKWLRDQLKAKGISVAYGLQRGA